MKAALWGLMIGITVNLYGQSTQLGLTYTGEIPIYDLNANQPFQNGWIGGFNAPQVHQIDLNNDGEEDLVVFDRTGNSLLTFERENVASDWIFNPTLKKSLPPIEDWLIIKDFNGDGQKDIFTSAINGIRVYKNEGFFLNTVEWELESPLLLSDYGNNTLNLFVSRVDLPGIEDIDNDGDLDILTFYILGTCVEYHRNMSVELFGNSDSLVFRLKSNNWGRFTEDATSNSITLNDSCGRFADGERHTGSTLLPYDLDSDGDKDLILGDVSYNEALFLINQPQNGSDVIIQTPNNYPTIWNNVGIPVFPTFSAIQANGDNLTDLIVGANTDDQSRNSGRTLLVYPGQAGNFAFTGQEQPFLCDGMPDFGRNSYPHLCDLDNDGDFDLLVGSGGRFIPSPLPNTPGSYLATIALFENTGTATSPIFRLRQNDLASLSGLGSTHLAPACADLNGDGRKDLIVGLTNGTFRAYFQSAGPAPFQFNINNTQEITSDAGDLAVPYLFDVNNDGLQDLIAGCRQGVFRLFLNNGSLNAASFPATPTNTNWGNANTLEEGISNAGHSAPALVNFNGNIQMMSGSGRGTFFIWPGSISDESWGSPDSLISFIDEGRNTSIAVADLNSDGFPDVISGNGRGGLSAYWGGTPTHIANTNNDIRFVISPNPTSNYFAIVTDNYIPHPSDKVRILSITGQEMAQYALSGQPFHIGHLSPGVYLIVLDLESGRSIPGGKLIVTN